MASSFNWLDYSEHERRRMLDVINLFQEKDTRDELGLGTVRDAFADLLFPGTSTIQTRAKYFLFIPWMYLRLEKQKVASNTIAKKARDEETALIDILARSDDTYRIIGIDARQNLKRLPSNIYWQGLGRWGIRLFSGSQDQYHRSLDQYYRSLELFNSRREQHQKDSREESMGESVARNWHPSLPPAPKEFPRNASLRLAESEAKYLRERILTHAPQSMLAFLVDEGRTTTPTNFPWAHPQLAAFPPRVREQLEHARNFSESIHGAALLYNLMLAEAAGQGELIEEYRGRLSEWASSLSARRGELLNWDRRKFWEIVELGNQGVRHLTRLFIDGWLDLVLSNKDVDVAADKRARQLVHDRERQLKRGQARLDNIRARELWNEEAGTKQLSYRWPAAQTIIQDILIAFPDKESHA